MVLIQKQGPALKKGQIFKVALLQLSTENDAYLIRLHGISDYTNIISILENTKIIKVGVAINDDLKILQKVLKFKPQNFVELQTLAKTKGLSSLG